MAELRFDDRVAIVTGAARGIGRSYALLLAARGARVVVADHGGGPSGTGSSPEPAAEVVREITDAGGQAVACCASVSEESSAAQIVDAAIESFGRLDIVVNNAGIHDPGLFADLTIDQFHRMIEVHYLGTLFVIRSAWPHLVRAGYGRVVNTVSEAMLGGVAELTSYGAAKGAVFGLTRNLATEGQAHGIRVNAIAPRAYTRLSAEHTEKMAAEQSIPKEMMAKITAEHDARSGRTGGGVPRSRIMSTQRRSPAGRFGWSGAHRCALQSGHLEARAHARGHRRQPRHHHEHG